MPIIKITDKSVDRLPLSDVAVEYFDSKLAGFGVRTGKKGKTYFVKGKADGKQFNRKIGRVGLMPFDDAYQTAVAILNDADQGVTPDQREAKKQDDDAITLELMLKKYFETRKTLKPRTKKLYQQCFNWYLDDWKQMPMQDITPAMVVAKHAEVGAISKAMSDGAFRVVRALYNFAMDMYEDTITRNPVKRLSTLNAWYRVPRKQKFIKPTQLPVFFEILNRYPGMVADYMELLLFTGVRSASEIAKLKIKDVDFKDQSIILHDTKSGKPLYVPACKSALAVLSRRVADAKAQGSEFLFYSTGTKKSSVGHLVDVRDMVLFMFSQTELTGLTPHDMRRSFLTYADEIELPNVVKKRLVGHAIPTDVTDGYIVLTMDRLRSAVDRIEAFILGHATKKPLGEQGQPGRG